MAIPVKWEFYQDVKKKWHWRHLGHDNHMILESRKGFKSKDLCEQNAKRHGYKDQLCGLDLEHGNFD